MGQPCALADFVAVIGAGLAHVFPQDHAGHGVGQQMQQALDQPVWTMGDGVAHRLPVCDHLPSALDAARRSGRPALRDWADAFAALAPALRWQRSTRAGSPAFQGGHANTQVIGPEGLARSGDVVLGASLLAPGVVYPEHDHPPEEIYLVMTAGDWFNRQAGWYTPGAGGAVHHPPGIVHAMRAGAQPLLAVWCLWLGP